MYQAKSGVKNFSLYWGGGGGVGSLDKNFFSQSEHVSSQIWCQKFFPLLGWGSLNKNFFFQSEHVSSQIWCQKCFPLLRPGTPPGSETGYPPWSENRYPPDLRLGTPPNLRPGTPPIWDWVPPPPGPGPGTPPTWTWTWDPPPKCGQTENITSRHPSDAGGNNIRVQYPGDYQGGRWITIFTDHVVRRFSDASVFLFTGVRGRYRDQVTLLHLLGLDLARKGRRGGGTLTRWPHALSSCPYPS